MASRSKPGNRCRASQAASRFRGIFSSLKSPYLGCQKNPVQEPTSPESEDSTEVSTRQRLPVLLKTLQRTALPWGFSPYNVSKHKQRHPPGLPHPTLLHLQAFSTSWRFFSASALTALFHAESVHGVLLSEASPSRKLPRLFAALVPSWSSLCTEKHALLQGFMQSGGPFSSRPVLPSAREPILS